MKHDAYRVSDLSSSYMLATWLDMWGVKAAFHHVVVCIARYCMYHYQWSEMSSMLKREAVWEYKHISLAI